MAIPSHSQPGRRPAQDRRAHDDRRVSPCSVRAARRRPWWDRAVGWPSRRGRQQLFDGAAVWFGGVADDHEAVAGEFEDVADEVDVAEDQVVEGLGADAVRRTSSWRAHRVENTSLPYTFVSSHEVRRTPVRYRDRSGVEMPPICIWRRIGESQRHPAVDIGPPYGGRNGAERRRPRAGEQIRRMLKRTDPFLDLMASPRRSSARQAPRRPGRAS
jgi:hypothetical protein